MTATARTVTISGNLQLDAGGTLNTNNPASVTNHSLLIGGRFTHNGTFTTSNTNGHINTTFNGSTTPVSYSGTGSGSFYNLTINKGAAANVVTLARNATWIRTSPSPKAH